MKYKLSNLLLFTITVVGFFSSCASKKEIILFSDIKEGTETSVTYSLPKIQVNDILDIKITTLNPETAIPYNRISAGTVGGQSIELVKLQGHLVSADGKISMPILGDIIAVGKTTSELEKSIISILENNGHLKNPTVSVRILNAKITVLGEVKMPGTYTYSEQSITLPQAIGYAGDVTIEANRKEVMLIREEEGKRKYHKIDLTKSDWFNSPYYTIKQNDIIYVYPNNVKVKSAGFIGNTSTVLSVFSILLTTFVLLTR
ncbi:MAG: polysaccharide export protein [Flavobacterium sp.]|jgi:polysaccharide export outer membrane protein|nr:polysaccharide export protein [Flavobacterium sp.]